MIGPLLKNPSRYHERSRRLLAAADAALARVHASFTPLGSDWSRDLFAPLGESLVWLVSLEDLLADADGSYWSRRAADPDGGMMGGVRYARNAVVHGELVLAATHVSPGAVLGAAPLGTFALGAGPHVAWAARSEINHTPTGTPHLPEQEQSYDAKIAGRDVLPPLQDALAFLRAAAGP
jgi:hypothetical protein